MHRLGHVDWDKNNMPKMYVVNDVEIDKSEAIWQKYVLYV